MVRYQIALLSKQFSSGMLNYTGTHTTPCDIWVFKIHETSMREDIAIEEEIIL